MLKNERVPFEANAFYQNESQYPSMAEATNRFSL